ncbi:LAQU0S06e01244g1_1 [Lachancea quebecensis]|uniref:LAQU0S06e01244g1_1 n=1 Tax=Lachancea quebecensis TaxID=1654605 RepID=A0A0P1KS12_9SACH|nr:LAQU0S06e01244g1_1 [Lachancea quebecensis]
MQPISQATQKDNSENKDNWIHKGLAWDPQCVIA